MKKYILFLLPLLVTACLDPEPPQPKPQGILVTSNITENTTWYSDSIYILGGRISVVSGAELTIQPGCIIKGDAGSGASATALVIARGGKLHAVGTANAPIIFTSIVDSIQPGMIASPNLDPTVRGLWGGLIVLGNAPISATAQTIQIEGIPTSDPNGLYGGTDTLDSSGELAYISIRHGGANIGSGNEINGLTLGGVGKGTLINHIEVVANQDDGIEIFGGNVNVSYVVVWNAGDDAIDTDQSWAGNLSEFVIITPSNHMFELDGPEGSYQAGHTIQNGDIYVGSTGGDLINVDNNSIVALSNLYFTDIQGIHQINRTTAPNVSFANIVLDVDSVIPYINGSLPASAVVAGQIHKANTAGLSWTWAKQAGKF
jgi:hypothetical protein